MKITTKKIILNLLPMLIINSLGIILLNYMFKGYNQILIITYLFLFFYSILPTIILTWNYYKENYNFTLLLREDIIELDYDDFNKKNINIKEIEFIRFVGLKNNFDKYNIRFSTFDNFYYVEIGLKGGFQVILTSLIDQNLREKLYNIYPNLNYSYKYTSFPIIKHLQ